MVRRTALLLLGLALSFALAAPATADSSGPVVAGTFTGSLRITDSWKPGGWGLTGGSRTYAFGSGCAVSSACTLTRDDGSTTALTPAGGAYTWTDTQPIGCVDIDSGAERTKHGFDYTWKVVLRPSSTTVVDGVTYATAMTGTYVGTLAVNATGRRFDCLVQPRRVPSETERGVYNLTLVPLAAPKPVADSAALAVVPKGTSGTSGSSSTPAATEGSIPGFTLPMTARQERSAAAVASGLRSSVPGALVTPREAVRTAADNLPRDLLWVALLGLLIVFPAQLFNSTYEENHERIDRQLARLRLRRRPAPEGVVVPTQGAAPPEEQIDTPPAPAASPPRGRRLLLVGACLLVGTVLGGLLDPSFGANQPSYALLLGIFLATLLTILLVAGTGRVFRSATHHGHGWYLRAIPSALLVAVVCVVVSRLTHFEPGYLYGVVGGAVFAVALDRRGEGRAEVAVTAIALVVALLAWIAFEPVARAANGSSPSFLVLAGDAFLASLFIGGLEGLMFGLVPLRFLPGARIKGWSWAVWGVLAAVVLYVFVHVLLMPESGYLGRSTTASASVTLGLFVAFGIVSVAFWGWFRLRPTPDEEPEAVEEPSAAEPAQAPLATEGAEL